MARKAISQHTIKKLFALSGNYCAFPECPNRVIDDNGNVIGKICHIEAAKKGGPRYNCKQTDDKRRSFENLILLCEKHHIETDDITKYPVEVLKQYKANHEDQFQDRLRKDFAKLLKSYDEVIRLKPSEVDPLMDWPIWEDLKSGEKSEVYRDRIRLNEINKKLTNPKIRRLLIKGAGGRGKTVLSRLFAYTKNKENWNVHFGDIREFSNKNEVTIEIDNIIRNSKPTLFILENAHLSDEITDHLVKKINHFVESYQECHFLFLSRDFARDEDINPFKHWKRNKWYIEIKPDQELIESIIKCYIKANDYRYEITEEDKEWIQNKLIYSKEENRNTKGGDLRLLRLYLNSWNYDSLGLHELKEENILSQLKEFVIGKELLRNPSLIRILGKISSIFQFDVPFYGERQSDSDTIILDEYFQKLNQRGLVKFSENNQYTMAHSLDAYYITKCLADLQKTSHEVFTGINVIDYLKKVITSTALKENIGDNIFTLFKGILRRKSDFNNLKVFKILYKEAKELLIETICINYRIGIITYLLQFIVRSYDKETAIHFWKELNLKTNNQFWIDKVKEGDDLSIALFVRNLGKISQQEGTLFFKNYIQPYQKSLYLDSRLVIFTHIITHLPLCLIDEIIAELEPDSFRNRILESSSIIGLNFIIDRFTKDDKEHGRREIGLQFLESVFREIEQDNFDKLKTLLLTQKGFKTIQILREDLNVIYPKLRNKIDTDYELAIHLRNLRKKNLKKLPSGTVLISKRMVKDSLHIKSNRRFLEWLSDNFTDFEFNFNCLNTISRFITRIFNITYNDDLHRELGFNVITKIIYQLPNEVIKKACKDLGFLERLENIDGKLYNYVSDKCKEIY